MDKDSESITIEVVRQTIAAMIIFSFLLAVVLYFQIKSTMIYVQNDALESRANQIASYIKIRRDGKVVRDIPKKLESLYKDASERLQYAVMDGDGKKLFASDDMFFDPFDHAPENRDHKNYFEAISPVGEKFLGVGMKRTLGGQEFTIYVAEQEASVNSFANFLINAFLYKAALVGVPLVLTLMIVIVWTMKRGFRPLVRISAEAKKIDYDNMDVRLPEQGAPVEVLPLVRAVNKALARLKDGIEEQKEFTANVAHEIRTPLTILKARIQNMEEGAPLASLNEDIDVMVRLVNQMLDIAKLDFSGKLEMKKVRLEEVAKNVCEDLGMLFVNGSRQVKLRGAQKSHEVNGNYGAVYSALRNIVENAAKYSPEGEPIEIHVADQEISVKDYGRPIDEKAQEKIFKRFYRRPVNGGVEGCGLGLAIASKVMELHGGEILLKTGRTKGNVFTLHFA